jgi:hypothetical protein
MVTTEYDQSLCLGEKLPLLIKVKGRLKAGKQSLIN